MMHISIEELTIVVISDAAPSRNGVGAYYQDLLEQLKNKVKQISLYSPSINDNGQWQAGFALPLPGDKTQKLCIPNIYKLNKLLNKQAPDIVIIATPGVYGLTGAYLAKQKGIPFLTGFHTSFEHLTELYWPNSIIGKIVEKYFLISNGYLLKRTEAVLGNAAPILEQAKKMGAAQTHLIGTPISSEFTSTPLMKFSGQLKSCLFAGRLAKEKNLEELLLTIKSMPELSFSIAGDGPLRELVESVASKLPNLQYMGWLSRKELRQAIDSHDALLLPSHFETFGTIALEAMSRKRLVFVSTGCGISNWTELVDGLFIIDKQENLSSCLLTALTLGEKQLIEKTEKAHSAAKSINNDVVDNWCNLLQLYLPSPEYQFSISKS